MGGVSVEAAWLAKPFASASTVTSIPLNGFDVNQRSFARTRSGSRRGALPANAACDAMCRTCVKRPKSRGTASGTTQCGGRVLLRDDLAINPNGRDAGPPKRIEKHLPAQHRAPHLASCRGRARQIGGRRRPGRRVDRVAHGAGAGRRRISVKQKSALIYACTAPPISSLARTLNGVDAKLGILPANGVFHVFGALSAPRLDRVHVLELKDDDAVRRRISD